jgi:hypothetical protein
MFLFEMGPDTGNLSKTVAIASTQTATSAKCPYAFWGYLVGISPGRGNDGYHTGKYRHSTRNAEERESCFGFGSGGDNWRNAGCHST